MISEVLLVLGSLMEGRTAHPWRSWERRSTSGRLHRMIIEMNVYEREDSELRASNVRGRNQMIMRRCEMQQLRGGEVLCHARRGGGRTFCVHYDQSVARRISTRYMK